MKFYLDTSVWIDVYEDRLSGNKKIGEYAFKLLCKLLASKAQIIVSKYVFMELGNYYSAEQIVGMTFYFEKVIEKVNVTEEQIDESEKLASEREVPKCDALHAVIARDNGAILVSRDRHFDKLTDVCEIAKPEDIIYYF